MIAVQHIQYVYAQLVDLSLCLLTDRFDRITQISGNQDLSLYLNEIQSRLSNEDRSAHSMKFELAQGAIILLERDSVHSNLMVVAGVLEAGTDAKKIHECTERMREFLTVADLLYESANAGKTRDERMKHLYLHACQILEDPMQAAFKLPEPEEIGLNFLGIATKESDFEYRIRHVKGGESLMAGSTFLLGEGALGRVAATGRGDVWLDIQKDQKGLFFVKRGLPVRDVFAYPIIHGREISGVLFCGTFGELRLHDQWETVGDWLSLIVTASMNQARLMKKYTQLSVILEMINHLMVGSDLKKICYILIDMCMNVAEGPCAYLLVRTGSQEQEALMISRGMPEELIKQVTQDLRRRYDNLTATRGTPPATALLNGAYREFKLVHDDVLLGILGVSYAEEIVPDELDGFFESFTAIGALALARSFKHSTDKVDFGKTETLFHVLKQWRPDVYEQGLRASRFLQEFLFRMYTDDVSETEREMLMRAVKLIVYEPDFLAEEGIAERIVRQVAEYRALATMETVGTRESQMLRLAWFHAKNEEERSRIVKPPVEDEILRDRYAAYINRFTRYEHRTFLREARQELFSSIEGHERLAELSKREQEVLACIAEGLGNKDIAKRLYISEHTVKNHISNIFQKLEFSERGQAIAFVYDTIYNQSKT